MIEQTLYSVNRYIQISQTRKIYRGRDVRVLLGSAACDPVSTAHLFLVSVCRVDVRHVSSSSSLSHDLNAPLSMKAGVDVEYFTAHQVNASSSGKPSLTSRAPHVTGGIPVLALFFFRGNSNLVGLKHTVSLSLSCLRSGLTASYPVFWCLDRWKRDRPGRRTSSPICHLDTL